MSVEVIKVLLVEDQPEEVFILRELLKDIPTPRLDLTAVERLSEAISRIENKPDGFDAILLDLWLPDSLGYETFESLYEHAPHIPIIVRTALNDEKLAVQTVGQGAQDYLVKESSDADEVVRAVQYAIERHRLQRDLRQQSLHDHLTGLYNQRGFLALAEQQLKNARRNGCSATLLYADLDRLKLINDTLGHAAGDRALNDIAELLRHVFRESDLIARVGGDEFVVLAIEKCDDTREAVEERLQNAMGQFNARNERRYQLSLTIGGKHFTIGPDVSLQDLLEGADRLMYSQKRLRRRMDPNGIEPHLVAEFSE